MKNNKGFSLVELIVVIAIMAILAAVAIPTFAHFITKANEASDKDYYAGIAYAAELAGAGEGLELTGIEIIVDDEKIVDLKVIYNEDDVYVVKSCDANVSVTDDEIVDAILSIVDFDYELKINTSSEAIKLVDGGLFDLTFR